MSASLLALPACRPASSPILHRPLQICRARARCLTVLKLGIFALLAWDTGNSAGRLQRWNSSLPDGDGDSLPNLPSIPSVTSMPSPPPAICSLSEAAAFRLWVREQSSADCPGEWPVPDEPAPAGNVTHGGGTSGAATAEEPASVSCCGGRSLPLVALVAEVGQVCYAAACCALCG